MKMPIYLKKRFYYSFGVLFLSGLLYLIFDTFIHVHGDLGIGPHPAQIWILRTHSIAGLWFLWLFGYIYARHIKPNLRQNDRKISGMSLYIPLIILCLTVPGLFYISDEKIKNTVALFHTYFGLLLIFPLLFHVVFRIKSKRGH